MVLAQAVVADFVAIFEVPGCERRRLAKMHRSRPPEQRNAIRGAISAELAWKSIGEPE
jgi:hypothetical protein